MSEKSELVYRCSRCGNEVHVQGTEEQAEKWLGTQMGVCPAGGNHVELGEKRIYLEFVRKEETLSYVPTKAEVLTKLLNMVKEKQPILVMGLGNKNVRTIHNFCNREIHKTVKHCGFGFFEGNTPKGTFSFDAGGAMHGETFRGGRLSWTPLRASSEVLEYLDYDFGEMVTALQKEIDNSVSV